MYVQICSESDITKPAIKTERRLKIQAEVQTKMFFFLSGTLNIS